MTLTDTGPLVALINRNDPNHAKCVAATKLLPSGPLITTWPCFTEAMYLLFRAGGFAGQEMLWKLLAAGRLALHEVVAIEVDRMFELMGRYRDKPMDLADASVVAASESLQTRCLFTLDSDLHVYRRADSVAFHIVP